MKLDKTLLKYCLYATGTVLVIYLGKIIFDNFWHLVEVASGGVSTVLGLVKPLFIALVMVYILKPGVNLIERFLEKKKIFKTQSTRRTIGIVFMYAFVIAIFLGVISGIYIMVGGKLSNNTTLSNMITYLTYNLTNSSLSVSYISEKLNSLNINVFNGSLNEKIALVVNHLQTYITSSIGNMTNTLLKMSENVATFFISAVLTIYLLKDFEYFLSIWRRIYKLIFRNSEAGTKVRDIIKVIDETFINYIKGQLLEAAMVGVLSTIALYIIGIDYALVIGIIAGVCNMIPYIGPVVGTILAVVMALLSGQPSQAVWAVVGMLVVQQLDNNILAPKIVGDSVGLHPVFTMLAILVGGNVGGLLGMLIAVPVAASIKILLGRWYNSHMGNLENNK